MEDRTRAAAFSQVDGLRRVDMHCHLDFADNAEQAAEEALRDGTGVFSVTVTPEGYERAAERLASFPNVRVGLGLHPWWIADGRCGKDEVERFCALAAAVPFIGEIGLDFGTHGAGTEDIQLAAFDREIAACAAADVKVVSLHAVRSVDFVLDALEQRGLTDGCTCILHWFSGSSDQLQRAIKLGCRFSIGSHMLATKRGRAYVQAIPVGQMLLETDAPPQSVGIFPYADLKAQLEDATCQLASILDAESAACIAAAGADVLNG